MAFLLWPVLRVLELLPVLSVEGSWPVLREWGIQRLLRALLFSFFLRARGCWLVLQELE